MSNKAGDSGVNKGWGEPPSVPHGDKLQKTILNALLPPNDVARARLKHMAGNQPHCLICLLAYRKTDLQKSYSRMNEEEASKLCELLRIPPNFFGKKLQSLEVCMGCHEKVRKVVQLISEPVQSSSASRNQELVTVRTFLATEISRFYFPLKMEEFLCIQHGNTYAVGHKLYLHFLRRMIIDEIRRPKSPEELQILDRIIITNNSNCSSSNNNNSISNTNLEAKSGKPALARSRCLVCLQESAVRNPHENPFMKLNAFESTSVAQVLELKEQSRKLLANSLICSICHRKLIQIPHLVRELDQVSRNLASAKDYVRAEILKKSSAPSLHTFGHKDAQFFMERQELEQELRAQSYQEGTEFDQYEDDDMSEHEELEPEVTIIELDDDYIDFSSIPDGGIEIIDDPSDEPHNDNSAHSSSLLDIQGRLQGQSTKLESLYSRWTSTEEHQCRYCWLTFHHEHALKLHEELEHTSKPPPLPQLTQKPLMLNNNNNSEPSKPFLCKICPSTFRTRRQLWKHRKVHKDNYPFKCELCSQGFIYRGRYRQHMLSHQGSTSANNGVPCTICHRHFPSQKLMETHRSKHCGDRRFLCHLCDKNYVTAAALRKHLDAIHGNEKFHCEVCSKELPSLHYLRVHMRVHADKENAPAAAASATKRPCKGPGKSNNNNVPDKSISYSLEYVPIKTEVMEEGHE